jgi:DNA-binding NarL/FixJ family response regulator
MGKALHCERIIRVLVVYDSDVALRTVCALLGTGKNIQVVGTAKDGCRALDEVQALRPDLVLMDMEMPVMNGLEATSLLRIRFPEIRVIVVTIHDNQEVQKACRAVGAHSFVAKSRAHVDLVAEICRLFPED